MTASFQKGRKPIRIAPAPSPIAIATRLPFLVTTTGNLLRHPILLAARRGTDRIIRTDTLFDAPRSSGHDGCVQAYRLEGRNGEEEDHRCGENQSEEQAAVGHEGEGRSISVAEDDKGKQE